MAVPPTPGETLERSIHQVSFLEKLDLLPGLLSTGMYQETCLILSDRNPTDRCSAICCIHSCDSTFPRQLRSIHFQSARELRRDSQGMPPLPQSS